MIKATELNKVLNMKKSSSFDNEENGNDKVLMQLRAYSNQDPRDKSCVLGGVKDSFLADLEAEVSPGSQGYQGRRAHIYNLIGVVDEAACCTCSVGGLSPQQLSHVMLCSCTCGA
jgi:hypothetical protein